MSSKIAAFVISMFSVAIPINDANAQINSIYYGSYVYPEQSGKEELMKCDPNNTILTDRKSGTPGDYAVWGKWGVKNATLDWKFADRIRISKMVVVINHPASVPPGESHPDRVAFYVGDDTGKFSEAPNATVEIPFEEGGNQTATIEIPNGGIVGRALRTRFITDHLQIAICEITFDASPSTDAETAPIKSRTIQNESSAWNDATHQVIYAYPDQPGIEALENSDPHDLLLTDGKSGIAGNQVTWGKWDVQSVRIDWKFKERVRVSKMAVVINHPTANSNLSHPDRVALYAGDANGRFSDEPLATLPIPFEEGASQTAMLELPNGGMVARTLRTEFITNHHQVVLSEVRFDTTPTSDEITKIEEKVESSGPPVTFLPGPVPVSRAQKKTPFFGVCGHMLHTTDFLKQFSRYWEPDFTIPLVANAGIDWVREPLYQPFFSDDGLGQKPNNKTAKENRDRVERYLSAYDHAGIAVLLAPMYGAPNHPEIPSFARWVGELAKKHPCVRGVELHNEPNLKGFWKGTPKEFVEASKTFVGEIKKIMPDVPIIAGSFSGWGAVWDRPDLKELVEGPKEISTLWAEKAFELGLLNLADGVSAHPYRGSSAPEGGDINEERLDPDGFEKEISSWLELCKKNTPGNRSLPFYITEIGYSVVKTKGYSAVSDEGRQADYLTRLMLLCLKLRLNEVPLAGFFWYDLKQDTTDYDYEANFGLVSADTARLRPGYIVCRRVAEAFPDVLDLVKNDMEYTFLNRTDKIKSFSWQKQSDGGLSLAFWRLNQLQKKDEDFPSEVVISVPRGFRVASIELTDLNEDRPRMIGFKVDGDGKVRVPLWVTARAGWITLRPEKN